MTPVVAYEHNLLDVVERHGSSKRRCRLAEVLRGNVRGVWRRSVIVDGDC